MNDIQKLGIGAEIFLVEGIEFFDSFLKVHSTSTANCVFCASLSIGLIDR